MTITKEYELFIWKFQQVPPGFWKDEKNQLSFLEQLKKELNYKSMEGLKNRDNINIADWYKVSLEEIRKCGGSTLLELYNNSLAKLISSVYKDYPFKVITAR